jgi:hypothetical protein
MPCPKCNHEAVQAEPHFNGWIMGAWVITACPFCGEQLSGERHASSVKRNVDATCGNCPFWYYAGTTTYEGWQQGSCRRTHQFQMRVERSWCGEHPDFIEARKAE